MEKKKKLMKHKHKEMPNRIEDMSPSPISKTRPKSPLLYKNKFKYSLSKH